METDEAKDQARMTPRCPDLTQALSAYYARRHPNRPSKDIFSDELLALADMLWAQIDADGSRPVIYPPAAAEGYEAQPSVRPSGKRGKHVG